MLFDVVVVTVVTFVIVNPEEPCPVDEVERLEA
jgi:hypothetical protein